MTIGLSVLTGASSETKVSITDQDLPPGLWLDYFTVNQNQTITKTYNPTSGTKLLVQAHSTNANISLICTITITGMTVVIKNQGSTLSGAGVTAAVVVMVV